jgi:hypothetical protein
MPPEHSTPFPFRSLPSEIRNKIYRELLCAFEPPPTTTDIATAFDSSFPLNPHAIDTTILRISTNTYCEAYDVLVKANRFVRITSASGIPLRTILQSLMVPIVAAENRVVQAFRGYVLTVHLGCKEPVRVRDDTDAKDWFAPHALIILHRDLDVFCRALADADAHRAGLIANLKLSIRVAPILFDQPSTRYAPSFDDFFSEATQKTLLAPFRKHLRGYTSVKISGHIDKTLARTTREEIKQDRWCDPQTVLSDFTAAKDAGTKLFQQRDLVNASLTWQDAAVDIDKIFGSTAWPKLVALGGQPFVSQLAERYFLVRLNIAYIQLKQMTEEPALAFFAGMMAEDTLHCAVKSLKQGHWMEGFKYKLANMHSAKLRYRLALSARLRREPGTAERALKYVDGALKLLPGDAAIMQERERIVAWVERGE